MDLLPNFVFLVLYVVNNTLLLVHSSLVVYFVSLSSLSGCPRGIGGGGGGACFHARVLWTWPSYVTFVSKLKVSDLESCPVPEKSVLVAGFPSSGINRLCGVTNNDKREKVFFLVLRNLMGSGGLK